MAGVFPGPSRTLSTPSVGAEAGGCAGSTSLLRLSRMGNTNDCSRFFFL